MIDRKPLVFLCTTGVPGKYPTGMDPESMAVQIAHDVWRWYAPEIAVTPAAEPMLRAWADFVVRVYRAAGAHGRKTFKLRATVDRATNRPLIQVVE